MLYGCKKCLVVGGAIFLVLGVIFLLRDLDIWNFWNIQWWTAFFIVVGIGSLGSSKCPDCIAMRNVTKK